MTSRFAFEKFLGSPTVGLLTLELGSSFSVLIRKDSADAPIQTWSFLM